MTQKLLLAESLDLLRQAEMKEYDTDKLKQRVSGSAKNKNELLRLLQSYDTVYHQYVQGIEILNYVRRTVLTDRDPRNTAYNKNMADFCAGKMVAFMDRCDNVVKKLDNIFIPIDLIDTVSKAGYTPEETIFIQDGTSYPLTRKEPVLAREFTLTDGTYILTMKNKDDYSVAAPNVDVTLTITPQRGSGTEPSHVQIQLKDQCGWRKVIGVVGAASLQLQVRAQGMRDSHVDILIQKWKSINEVGYSSGGGAAGAQPSGVYSAAAVPTDYTNFDSVQKPQAAAAQPQANPWVNQLPSLPDDELARLANYNVPSGALPAQNAPRPAPSASAPPQDPWAQLEQMNVPHVGGHRQSYAGSVPDPIEVNPAGYNCKERGTKLRMTLDAWPQGNVAMASLPPQQQNVVSSVYALPLPRDLN